MSQYSWNACPVPIRQEVSALVSALQQILAENLVGIYLHGSLSMGCFNPDRSDLDLLVVTDDPISVEVKRRCVELLLRVSAAPVPIEISFLVRRDLHPWRYPPPFDLHFSEIWRDRYEKELANGVWTRWNDSSRTDPDLAAHITHLRDRGVVLFGPPIGEVFPEVPRADYLASILADYEEARDGIARNPVYGVLNMCRVYRYLMEGTLSSKDEAGEWARRTMPAEERAVIEAALGRYRGNPSREDLASPALTPFIATVDERVRKLLRE
jgi:streptomycin 3"-adenylyltransferase